MTPRVPGHTEEPGHGEVVPGGRRICVLYEPHTFNAVRSIALRHNISLGEAFRQVVRVGLKRQETPAP